MQPAVILWKRASPRRRRRGPEFLLNRRGCSTTGFSCRRTKQA
ncbi:hypothetical protein T1E_3712 [Pseudomonas putida DOT-T1E]|uniref:Uncharacterized protein n=1 Tax=Pseudomonas putida (strain DOT-T1E) TaxID=1196325 RepID=I7B3F3_PSEPT|nr:hypothetical protein T1E_3712 [Pseudomonas putida DOT-T1E]